MPKVSVIMPSYNHECYVSDSVRSVLNQSTIDLELIVVDDASVDCSKNIIESWASFDSRIVPIYHSCNQGISRTLNDGLNKAEGEYVAFLASDDIWRSDKLERQLDLFKTERHKVIWTEGAIINRDGHNTGDTFTHLHRADCKRKSGNLLQELLAGNFIFGSSLIVEREDLNGLGFDESLKYLNDYKFVVDLARTLEFIFIPEPLAAYRVHGFNCNTQDRTAWSRDRQRLQIMFLAEYGDMMPRTTRAGAYVSLCDAKTRLDDRPAALDAFLRALACAPEKPVVWLNAVRSLTQEEGILGRTAATIHRELVRLSDRSLR